MSFQTVHLYNVTSIYYFNGFPQKQTILSGFTARKQNSMLSICGRTWNHNSLVFCRVLVIPTVLASFCCLILRKLFVKLFKLYLFLFVFAYLHDMPMICSSGSSITFAFMQKETLWRCTGKTNLYNKMMMTMRWRWRRLLQWWHSMCEVDLSKDTNFLLFCHHPHHVVNGKMGILKFVLQITLIHVRAHIFTFIR